MPGNPAGRRTPPWEAILRHSGASPSPCRGVCRTDEHVARHAAYVVHHVALDEANSPFEVLSAGPSPLRPRRGGHNRWPLRLRAGQNRCPSTVTRSRVDRASRVPLISVRGGPPMAQGASISEVPARRTIPVTNPATGARLAEYPVADREAVTAAVARAREAQPRWAALGFAERGRILRKVRDRFVDEKDRICDVVSGETGKPRHDVITNELLFLCDAIGFWSKRAGKYLADEPARPHLLKNKRVYVSFVPHGVIGIIGPWNFPFNLTIGEAIPALMAGNAVVIKPSEVTPGSAALGAELALAAGLPAGVLQVVTGYGETGQHLIECADMICFTGSVATGRKVAERCGQLLKPVTLELGGKDPMIVLGDADLERASSACVYGGLVNAGQVCISVERVYVEASVYDTFVGKVVDKVRQVR
ncbi:MAG: aldehyde dehydrogenase family protein, partial [Deltaproteobacteria bacterium]